MPGLFMVVVGTVDAAVTITQGSSPANDIVQWLTVGGFLAIGGWAIKDHIALRKEKIREVETKAEADKKLQEDLQAIHSRFDNIDRNIKGDDAYPGLLRGDNRNKKRRHFMMDQLAAFGLCLIEMNKGIGRLVAKEAGVEYAEEEIASELRGIIKQLRRSDEEQERG